MTLSGETYDVISVGNSREEDFTASEWQCDKLDWSGKNADFSTLIGCHGNVP